jgi:hypothetical protein
MPLATDQTAGLATYATGMAQLASDTVTAARTRRRMSSAGTPRCNEGHPCRCPDPEALQVRRPARL